MGKSIEDPTVCFILTHNLRGSLPYTVILWTPKMKLKTTNISLQLYLPSDPHHSLTSGFLMFRNLGSTSEQKLAPSGFVTHQSLAWLPMVKTASCDSFIKNTKPWIRIWYPYVSNLEQIRNNRIEFLQTFLGEAILNQVLYSN